jgi:hypothetical protein
VIFVELCAGSAAVSLRWLSSRAKPPLSYQGGKRGYADAILRAMGQSPGAGRGHEIVLCEPGPWGEAWEHWRTAEGRADTAERLEAWAAEDPRTLWERLRRAPVPADVAERVATWAVLQFWSFGNKVVEPAGAGWNEHGFNKAAAYRREHHEARRAAGLKVYTGDQMRLDVQLLRAIRALPDLSRVRVHRGPAQSLVPIPGAICYLDPDYQGTTGYAHTFPRAGVLATAQRWREAGCLVVVSEAEPLPLPGWHHHKLGGPVGFGRTWSKAKNEFITMSRPPMGQLSLMREA